MQNIFRLCHRHSWAISSFYFFILWLYTKRWKNIKQPTGCSIDFLARVHHSLFSEKGEKNIISRERIFHRVFGFFGFSHSSLTNTAKACEKTLMLICYFQVLASYIIRFEKFSNSPIFIFSQEEEENINQMENKTRIGVIRSRALFRCLLTV